MRAFLCALLLFWINSAFADELIGFAAFENGDYSTAYPHLMQAARDGNGDAMYLLGKMYEFGYGVLKDTKEAREWYVKGSEKIMH